MVIKMLTTMASPELVVTAGEVIDLPNDVATELLNKGYATWYYSGYDTNVIEPEQVAVVKKKSVRTKRASKRTK